MRVPTARSEIATTTTPRSPEIVSSCPRDPAPTHEITALPAVALGFWCDEAVTRWVKTEVVAVVVVVAVAVAVQLFRSAAETHTCSAFRNSMCIVAR